jgi:glycine/D-amino acid oxidase-like deaminating enzyme
MLGLGSLFDRGVWLMRDFDLIVVGGGITGLCSALYGASMGKRVGLFESGSILQNGNASKGRSRFFRIMYESAQLATLAELSYALWSQLENRTRCQLLDRYPLLFYGDLGVAETVEGDLRACASVMEQLGIAFDSLSASQMRELYPVFRDLPTNYRGLLQCDAAVIKADVCIRAIFDEAESFGVRFFEHSLVAVDSQRTTGAEVVIQVGRDTYTANQMVIAAGVGTNALTAPLGVDIDQQIWLMTIAHFPVDNNDAYPFWYEFGQSKDGSSLFYGFPVGTDLPGCVKASTDFSPHIGRDLSPSSFLPDQNEVKRIAQHLGQRFTGIEEQPQLIETCHYAMSRSGKPILSLLPRYDNIAVLAGESGRSFKFAPAFGRKLNNLLDKCNFGLDTSELLPPV